VYKAGKTPWDLVTLDHPGLDTITGSSGVAPVLLEAEFEKAQQVVHVPRTGYLWRFLALGFPVLLQFSCNPRKACSTLRAKYSES
jgi:hypothetical protein